MNLPRYDDPRVIEAGNEAFGLLVRAIAWAASHGMDHVPAKAGAMLGGRASWRRLAAAGLARIEGTGAAAKAFLGPFSSSREAEPSASFGELRGLESEDEVARRRAKEAARKRAQRAGQRAGHPGTCPTGHDGTSRVMSHVTRRDIPGHVPADVPTRAPLSLSSSIENSSEIRERDAREDRDMSRHVPPTLPAFDGDVPAFVPVVITQFAHGRGIELDPVLEWQGFLGNAHARALRGEVASASEGDFRLWVSRSVKREETERAQGRSSRRIVQTDPAGRPFYEVADPNDPL